MTGLSGLLVLMKICVVFFALAFAYPVNSSLDQSKSQRQFEFGVAPATTQGSLIPRDRDGALSGRWNVIAGAAIPPSKINYHAPRARSVFIPGPWPFKESYNKAEAFTFWADVNLSRSRLSGDNFSLWPGRFISEFKIFVEDESGGFYKAY